MKNYQGRPHPRYDEAHNEKAHALVEGHNQLALRGLFVLIDGSNGDVFWGASYGGSAEDRKALLHWLDTIRTDIKAYQKKHDTM